MQDVTRNGIRGAIVAGALALSFGATAAAPGLDAAQQARVEACFDQLERHPEDEAAAYACLAETGALPAELQALMEAAADPDLGLQQESERWAREAEIAVRSHADTLALRGDARSLLAAVLLSPLVPSVAGDAEDPAYPRYTPSDEVVAWFDAARAIRPADPLVAWYEATGCKSAAMRCDGAAAIGRLLTIEPDNAAVHLFALSAAQAAGDATAARTHLALAAAAPRYEPPAGALMRLILDKGADIAWPSLSPRVESLAQMMRAQGMGVGGDEQLALMATAQWAAAISPMGGVANVCLGAARDKDADPALHQDCRAVLERLATEGHILVENIVGLTGMVEMTAGTIGGAHWREQLRRYYWTYAQATNLMGLGRAQPPVDFVTHSRRLVEHGELAAMRVLLRERGIAVEPARDWLPDNPRHRALVTTGIAPAG